MPTGTIGSLVCDKGFGFIRTADGTPDVFFHRSALSTSIESLELGQPVSYTIDAKSAKPRAASVEPQAGWKSAGRGGRDNKRPSRPGDGPRGGGRLSTPRGGDRSSARGDRTIRTYGRGDQNRGDRNRTDRRGGERGRDDRRSSDERRGAEPGRRSGHGGQTRTVRKTSQFRRPDDRPIEFGFVTKLYSATTEGYISSVNHGTELWFTAADVIGETPYDQLKIGDYVGFIRHVDDGDPENPAALGVFVTEREQLPTRLHLPRHKRAQRKKPSWRDKKTP